MSESLSPEQTRSYSDADSWMEKVLTLVEDLSETYNQNPHSEVNSNPTREALTLSDSMEQQLGIHQLLYDEHGDDQPDDPLLTMTERLYIVGWWSLFSTSTYCGYKFSPKQQLWLPSEIAYWVIMFIVVAVMAIPNCKEKRNWVLHNVLRLDPEHSQYYDHTSRVAQFYNGLKMWLLMPLVFLGIWAPWAPASRKWAWIGTVLPILCIVIGATLLGFDSYHMVRVATHRPCNTHDFNKYFWALLFDTCELLAYVVAVIIFNQPNTIQKLFEFDHTNITQPKPKGDVGNPAGDSSNACCVAVFCQNDDEKKEVGMWDKTKSPFSVYCGRQESDPKETDEQTEEERDRLRKIFDEKHDKISDKLVHTAWKWVVWFLSPALMYCYVAYVSSVLFDASSNDWRALFPQNRWLPWLYDVSPLGGTNFSVGTGYVSGVLLVLAAYVWFVCMTVSMELNRIAIRRAQGHLDPVALYKLIEMARKRMDCLVAKFKYIIAIQFIYSVILLSLIFIHVFRVVPPSIAVLDVNGWTGVSAFVLVFEFVATAHYASNICRQWDMIVAVVVAQQQEHLQNPQNVPDFAPIYDHLKLLSPFGIRIFGFEFNMTFVKTLAVGVLTQVAGFVWAWLTKFLKT